MEIKKGDKGQDVVDIQRRLAYLGYNLGLTHIDGFFALRTEAAVRRFQRDKNLPVTGIVDEKTWQSLVESTYRLGSRVLYLRSPFFRGDDVKQLQTWLNTLGFRTEPIDGVFGPSTEQAVREFQENIGLTCDGIVGPETVAALNNLRFILDKNRAISFPALGTTHSILELLANKLVGIGCSAPHKKQWLAKEQNLELICLDIAYRLSNLLEILGAETTFFRLGEPSKEAQANIAFASLKKQQNKVVIEAAPSKESRELADLVKQHLLNLTAESQISVSTLNAHKQRTYICLKLGKLEIFKADDDLKKDLIRQKFASAVFDAITRFFEGQTS